MGRGDALTAVTGDCLFPGGLGRTTKPADFKSHAARTKDRVRGANLGRGLPPTAGPQYKKLYITDECGVANGMSAQVESPYPPSGVRARLAQARALTATIRCQGWRQ